MRILEAMAELKENRPLHLTEILWNQAILLHEGLIKWCGPNFEFTITNMQEVVSEVYRLWDLPFRCLHTGARSYGWGNWVSPKWRKVDFKIERVQTNRGGHYVLLGDDDSLIWDPHSHLSWTAQEEADQLWFHIYRP